MSHNNIASSDAISHTNIDDLSDPDSAADSVTISENDCSPELQTQMLAHILNCQEVADVAARAFNPNALTSEAHRIIAKLATEYWAAYGKLIPPALLKENFRLEIRGKNSDRQVAMMGELAALSYFTTDSPEYWCDQVVRLGQRHQILKGIQEFIKGGDSNKFYAAIDKAKTDCNQSAEYELFSPAELQAMDAIEWRIADHFPSSGTVCVFGPSGSCKSFYVLDMAGSVACGIPFLGRHEVKQGSVLYINSEGSYNLKTRIAAWCAGHGVEIKDVTRIVFSTISHNLQDSAEIDKLIQKATAKLGQIDLVIVDTLSRNFGPGDTDKNADMQAYLRGVDRIREKTGAAVVSVHHTGWADVGRERGAKSLRDYCDSSISVTSDSDKDSLVEISCKKQKDAEPFEDYSLAKTKEAESLWLRYVRQPTSTDNDSALLRMVPEITLETEPTEANTVSSSELICHLGLDNTKFSRLSKKLIEAGALQKVRFGSAKNPYRYFRYSDLSS